MLHVPKGFFNLKAVVVDLHDLGAATAEVIGQNIPGFFGSATFGRADDPQFEAEQCNDRIFLDQRLYLYALPVKLDKPTSLQANVEGSTLACKWLTMDSLPNPLSNTSLGQKPRRSAMVCRASMVWPVKDCH